MVMGVNLAYLLEPTKMYEIAFVRKKPRHQRTMRYWSARGCTFSRK